MGPLLGVLERELGSAVEGVILEIREDMKKDGINVLKRLAEFLGFAFSKQEEETGVIHIEEILRLCSFEKLSGLQVNKTGELALSKEVAAMKSSYFRKGKIGDWKNDFTEELAEKFDGILEETGLNIN